MHLQRSVSVPNLRFSADHERWTFVPAPADDAISVLSAPTRCSHSERFEPTPKPVAPVDRYYERLADGLWYGGHLLGVGSLASYVSVPAAAAILGLAQIAVIASRPIGRLQPPVVKNLQAPDIELADLDASDAQRQRASEKPATSSQRWHHFADGMWYAGHVLSLGSLLSRTCMQAAAALVGVAELAVIASRPVGRIQSHLTKNAPPSNVSTVSQRYQHLADGLWYAGHVMCAGSLLSHVSLPAAGVLVGVGQLTTIVSRPIGRWKGLPPWRSDDTHP